MAYWNAAGLAATRAVEGGSGGYTARDPNSSASGAYSFLDSTWRTYAPQAGVDINQYPRAYMAPPAAQDAVASITPVSNWGGTWAGSGGANAINPAYIQSTPMTQTYLGTNGSGANFTPPASTPDYFTTSTTPGSQSSYPITNGTDPNASFSFNDPATVNDPTMNNFGSDYATGLPGDIASSQNPSYATGLPTDMGSQTGALAQSGTGTPVQVNLGPQTASDLQSYINAPIKAAQTAISSWFAQASNWFTRGFLIVVALIVILVALWRVSGSPSGPQIIEQMKV